MRETLIGMADARERDQAGDRLAEQIAALKILAQELTRSIADLAGRIALTYDEVARVHEEIAQNGVSAIAAHAPEHAERAHRFAEHERSEQQRWSSIAHLNRHQQPDR
jgi:uncharacterized small protein (DUF1192 family)